MIRIGTIWDRTVAVIGGRFAILAAIALALLVAPGVVQGLVAAIAGSGAGPGAGAGVVNGVLNIVALVLTVWGGLAIVAVASDPVVDRAAAFRIGLSRTPAGLAVLLIALVAVTVAAMPGVLLIISSGFDMARAQAGLPQGDLAPGRVAMAALYFTVLLLVGLWLSARLVPLFAIVANERRGLGAFRRSFALTRGATLKLIGVLLLYAIVVLVVLAAATSVVGLLLRLLAGADNPGFVSVGTAIVGALVTAVFGVLQYVFSAQYYVAARDAADPA